MYNAFYAIQNRIAVTGAVPVATYQVSFKNDYYLFDLAGLDAAATGVNVNLDIINQTKNRRLMSAPCRAGLCSVMQPGDSSWLHPVLFEERDVLEVTATLAGGAPAATFDHCLIGHHHAGGVPEWCPQPKELFFYVFDFGNFNIGQTIPSSEQIIRGKTYTLLGWTATPNASALNTIEYKIRNASTSEEWQDTWVPGACLFPNFAANMRRFRFRIPQVFRENERIEIEARNVSGAVVTDVALAFYGYHERIGA